MPLQNRVTPLGDLVADPGRGLVYGNRGCLHDAEGRIRRHHQVRRWIACRLEFRGWHREPLLQPGRFTELFFLDDATALAAGHRPCALCRRADYDALVALLDGAGADAIDARLQEERLADAAAPRRGISRTRRVHDAALDDLPDGAYVLRENTPWLVLGDRLHRWTAGGYDRHVERARGERARLLTPPALVALLGSGWQGLVPLVHPSARR